MAEVDSEEDILHAELRKLRQEVTSLKAEVRALQDDAKNQGPSKRDIVNGLKALRTRTMKETHPMLDPMKLRDFRVQEWLNEACGVHEGIATLVKYILEVIDLLYADIKRSNSQEAARARFACAHIILSSLYACADAESLRPSRCGHSALPGRCEYFRHLR